MYNPWLRKCGLGVNNRGLSFDVNLKVSPGQESTGDSEIYTVVMGRKLTVDCPFTRENAAKMKSVYYKAKRDTKYRLIANSYDFVDREYTNRVQLQISGTSALKFTFIITKVKPRDAGTYMCIAQNPSPDPEGKEFDLQVFQPEPELAYADLRGSVNFNCNLGSSVADGAQFLCRVNKKGCDVVINTLGEKAKGLEGRVLLTPKNGGSFSVLLVGLRKEDAGRYVCGAHRSGQLQEGSSSQAWDLFVNEETSMPASPSVVRGVEGGSVTVRCPYNPKEKDSVKYWCRWQNTANGDCPLLVQSQGVVQAQYKNYQGRLELHEEPGDGTYTVILNQLTPQDAGFYWCLTSGDDRWTTMVEVKIVDDSPASVSKNIQKEPESQDVSQVNAAPGKVVREPSLRKIESNVNQEPSLLQESSLFAEDRAVKDSGSPDDGSRASLEASSSVEQGGSSTVLISTLVPLALVLTLGAVALAVARARHRRNVDRISIRSYRTDISMSDLENSRDFGGNDNMGAAPDNQETSLGRKDDAITTTKNTTETEEPKKAKRSSKEEADMAYAAFLFQSSNMAAKVQDSPSEA